MTPKIMPNTKITPVEKESRVTQYITAAMNNVPRARAAYQPTPLSCATNSDAVHSTPSGVAGTGGDEPSWPAKEGAGGWAPSGLYCQPLLSCVCGDVCLLSPSICAHCTTDL